MSKEVVFATHNSPKSYGISSSFAFGPVAQSKHELWQDTSILDEFQWLNASPVTRGKLDIST